MESKAYYIANISCQHCVHTIKSEVSEIPGVISVEADEKTKMARIVFEPPAKEDQIITLLAEINYPVSK